MKRQMLTFIQPHSRTAAQPHSRTACALSIPDFSGQFPLQNAPFLLPSERVSRELDHFYCAKDRFSAKPIGSTANWIISTSERTISTAQKAVFPRSRAFLPHSGALALHNGALAIHNGVLGTPSGALALRNGAPECRIRPSPHHPVALPIGSRPL